MADQTSTAAPTQPKPAPTQPTPKTGEPTIPPNHLKVRVKPDTYHWHRARKTGGRRRGQAQLFDEGETLVVTREQYRAFRDKFDIVDEAERKKVEPKLAEERVRMHKKHHGAGRYHVYNSDTGKKLTEKYVTAAEADDMIERG